MTDMREALEPFANVANCFDDELDSDDRPVGPFALKFCRAARSALAASPQAAPAGVVAWQRRSYCWGELNSDWVWSGPPPEQNETGEKYTYEYRPLYAHPPASSLPGREEIARIIDPFPFTSLDRRAIPPQPDEKTRIDVALQKADAILALLARPVTPGEAEAVTDDGRVSERDLTLYFTDLPPKRAQRLAKVLLTNFTITYRHAPGHVEPIDAQQPAPITEDDGSGDIIDPKLFPEIYARQPEAGERVFEEAIDAEVEAIMAMTDDEIAAQAKAEGIDLKRSELEGRISLQVAIITVAAQKLYALERDDENSNETAIRAELLKLNDARRAILALLSTAPQPEPVYEAGWRDISSAPKDGTPIKVPELFRFLPYKPEGRRQMKVAGRWQRWNGYGFENTAIELTQWLPSPPKGGADV